MKKTIQTNLSQAQAQISSNHGYLRTNNFDLLRFLFALIVFLVHAYALSGEQALSVLSRFLSSSIAVKSFFVVSGFLIFMSYENSQSIKSYFMKRVRRIYPAYFVVVIICTLLGYMVSTYSFADYWSMSVVKYVVSNLLFLNFLAPDLPGVFESNQLQAVNGALWTLKIEVMFYLFVPLAVMAFRKLNRPAVLLTIYVASALYSFVLLRLADESGASIFIQLQRQLPGQLTFFMAGAAAYYYYDCLVKFAWWAITFAIACFIFESWLPWLLFEPIALTILVISTAYLLPYLGRFARYGDFSYGIYIVHFPIIQVLISRGLFQTSPLLALALSGTLVLVVAFFLWHFIEKPFLRKSSYYVSSSFGRPL